MKKSLNNTIRGKRLVVGDENEVTSHEILVEDKDNKVTLKQRGSDGNIETLSGGGSDYNIWYYCYGSYEKANTGMTDRQEYALAPYKDFKDFLFSTEKGVDYSHFLYSPQIIKTVMLQADSNIQMSLFHSYISTIDIAINVSKGAKGVAISNYMDTNLVDLDYIKSPIFIKTIVGNPSYLSVYKVRCRNGATDIDEKQEALYDAASNILYYFTAASTLNITINPELESTLRIISITYRQEHNYKPRVNNVTHKWEFFSEK